MFQLDSKFSNAALDALVADLSETKPLDAPVSSGSLVKTVSVANENRPSEDKIAWEDEETYFVFED